MVVLQFISYNLCLFVSINSGSGIFARECHKLGASWGSCLSQWASSFSSGSSSIWEFQLVKMRVPAQSSIYWRSRKHQPTSLLSSISFAELTILAGYHLSWSRRHSTDVCSWTPFVRVPSPYETWFCPEKLWWTCDCHCDHQIDKQSWLFSQKLKISIQYTKNRLDWRRS